MDSEQEITVGAWAELESQLAEVRAKRDQLQAMNERVTDNLKRTIEERDQAVAEVESLRAEYLKHKEAANVSSDQAASLREQLQEMTSLRDATERTADAMRVSRDEARKAAADLQSTIEKLRAANKHYQSEWVQAKEAADAQWQGKIHELKQRQIPDELSGMLQSIRLLAEQAAELI
jgi:uncharacterized coiled-coil DUF342 family protein